MESKSKRQANFELLRIVAMFMIIVLHYLVKGWVATPFPFVAKENPVGVLAWLIESFCIVAVNCYVLISGYFLVESAWKPGRLVSLLAQVLFYSLLIPLFFLAAGGISGGELDIYDWIGFAFPFGTEHYWFATAYLVMYVLAPFLAEGTRRVEKRTLQVVIGILVLYFSVWKSVLPVRLATDRYGYDFGWFVCLFLIAAYIRLYGLPKLERRKNAVLLYVGMCLGIFLLTAGVAAAAGKVAALEYYMDMPTTYDHILCLAGAIGLFMVCKDTRLPEGRLTAVIRGLAPYTFGVYLVHEHLLVRYEWMQWLGVDNVRGSWLFVPHMIGCVLVVYVTGTAADFVRERIFYGIRKIYYMKKR